MNSLLLFTNSVRKPLLLFTLLWKIQAMISSTDIPSLTKGVMYSGISLFIGGNLVPVEDFAKPLCRDSASECACNRLKGSQSKCGKFSSKYRVILEKAKSCLVPQQEIHYPAVSSWSSGFKFFRTFFVNRTPVYLYTSEMNKQIECPVLHNR